MALRSPTPFHSSWGSHPTVSLPSGSEVQVGDTAYDTTLGKLVVCTSVGPVVWTVVGNTPSYPDPTQAVLAWDFTGASGTIANIGSAAGAFPDAGLSVNLNTPLRNIPGPINAGTGFGLGSPTTQSTGIRSSEGTAVNLGSSLFTSATGATFVIFFNSKISDFLSGYGSENILGLKSWEAGTWNPPWNVVGLVLSNGTYYGYFGNGNVASIPVNSPFMSSMFRQGMHMAAVTFEGGVATRLYFDGVEVAAQTTGVNATVGAIGVSAAPGDGAWWFGANQILTASGYPSVWPCVIYAARVYNVTKSAAWVQAAWKTANGWP